MSRPAKRKLSKRDSEYLNKLELTPEVEEALLNEWPILERLLSRSLTLKEAYEIACDGEESQ
jgi:hypothetical protein